MAHFAKLSDANVVLSVEVVNDSDCLDENNNESEAVGIQHQTTVHGWSLWKQCSYNTHEGEHKLGGTPFRKNYPGIGCTYDPARDAFIRPRPSGMDSWIFNESKCVYECPVARPAESTDRFEWIDWIESSQRWERKFPAKDSDGNDVYPSDMEEYWNPDTSSWVSI